MWDGRPTQGSGDDKFTDHCVHAWKCIRSDDKSRKMGRSLGPDRVYVTDREKWGMSVVRLGRSDPILVPYPILSSQFTPKTCCLTVIRHSRLHPFINRSS